MWVGTGMSILIGFVVIRRIDQLTIKPTTTLFLSPYDEKPFFS